MTDLQPARARPARLLACLFLAVLLVAGSADATWTVNDPQFMNRAIEQYNQQREHYRQQLIRLQPLQHSNAAITQGFSERSVDYRLQERCPGAGRRGGDKAATEQRTLCARIVMARNTQYNATVRMLDRLVARHQQFMAIQQQRSQTGTRQGDLAANDNEVLRFIAQNALERDYWMAQMKAYDGYIDSLEADRSRLARQALDGGPPNLLGEVIQARVLAHALSH